LFTISAVIFDWNAGTLTHIFVKMKDLGALLLIIGTILEVGIVKLNVFG